MKKKTACECGGSLRSQIIKAFDFSAYCGFPLTITSVPGFVCSSCHGETIEGGTVNMVLNNLVLRITASKVRVSGAEAKFLRRALAITQSELADRMGIVRETVAKWECGEQPISAQHDFILRAFVTAPNPGLAVRIEPPKPALKTMSWAPSEIKVKEPTLWNRGGPQPRPKSSARAVLG